MRVDGLVGWGKWGIEVGLEEKETTSHWGRYVNMYSCDSTIAGHKAGLRRDAALHACMGEGVIIGIKGLIETKVSRSPEMMIT